jgi:hypothetical protein
MHKSVAVLFIALVCTLKPHAMVAAISPDLKAKPVTAVKYTDSALLKFAGLSAKAFEKSTGHRLKFKERLALKLLQFKWKKAGNKNFKRAGTDEKIEKKALWSKWLGIGSLIGLFIPGVGLLSLPAAIVAIVLGADTLKKTTHPRYSRQGFTFGIITLALILIVGFIVALVTLLPVA